MSLVGVEVIADCVDLDAVVHTWGEVADDHSAVLRLGVRHVARLGVRDGQVEQIILPLPRDHVVLNPALGPRELEGDVGGVDQRGDVGDRVGPDRVVHLQRGVALHSGAHRVHLDGVALSRSHVPDLGLHFGD